MSLLTRIAHSHPELNFRVEQSNPIEDHTLKYDFKIVVPREVDGKTRVRVYGVQLTTSADKKLQHKQEQIVGASRKLATYKNMAKRPAQEIIFAPVPSLKQLFLLVDEWLDAGMPSGGPDQYLTWDQIDEVVAQTIGQIKEIELPEEITLPKFTDDGESKDKV